MKKLINIFILLSLILPSCSITKRVYQPGYHIEWRTYKTNNISEKSATFHSTSPSPTKQISEINIEDNYTLQLKTQPNEFRVAKKENKKIDLKVSKKKILDNKISKQLLPKKARNAINSSFKGVNLQEPSGQLFLLGILSLIFLGGGIALLYFTTPPQINMGYLLLLIGTICLLTFFRILAGMFAEWAFG